MPDWDLMKHALAVGRSGTISGAAKKLKVDHTTVGRKLAALEDELGFAVFVRETRRLTPTAAGRAVLASAERMEEAMLDLERKLVGLSENPTGTVRVATSEAFSSVLVGCLPGLREEHPNLRVEVLAGNRVLDLTRGEADLAVRMTATHQESLVCKKLFELDWAVFASREYVDARGRPTMASLDEHCVVGFEDRMSKAPGARWTATHVPPERIVMRGDSLLAVRAAILSGLGIAAIPVLLSIGQPNLVRVVDEPVGSGPCYLVVHADLRKAPHIRTVMDYIEAHLHGRAEALGARVGRSAD